METDILQQGNIDTGITAEPSPDMAMGEMGGGDMTPDEAAAALAFITKLSEGQMEQQGMMQGEQPMQEEQMAEATMEEPEEEVVEEEVEEPEEEMEEDEEDDTDSRVEEITSSMEKMHQEHEKAIESLRNEIKDESMRKDYEKKIAKLEEKHSKQLESLKEEIKGILDEDSD